MSKPVLSAPASKPATPSSVPLPNVNSVILNPIEFAAVLCVAAGLLLAGKVLTGATLAVWFVFHATLVAATVFVLWRNRASLLDVTPYALALIATLIAGPAGALLAVLALLRMKREPSHSELLAAWYDRIALAGDTDEATGLYNTVAMGRALNTSASPPQLFDAVMTHGSLADRQTALGLIARQFSPSYAPALRHALVSPEPVIRVQAAAVAVKVRAELKHVLAAALSRARVETVSPAEAAGLAVELYAIVASGLLEDDDRDRADATAKKLLAAAVNRLVIEGDPRGEIDASAQALIETELLRRGNFQTFRDQRQRAVDFKGARHV